VIVSFGGAGGPELATTCTDASSLQAQYQAVVTQYSLKTIDLDIEAFAVDAINLRNKALTGLEAANPTLKVQYTLGVGESGLGQSQLSIIENAKANGTRINRVNIMTMDYGHPVKDMYAAAISAAQGTRKQLDNLGFTSTELGITPMLGVNDSAEEIFTLENATSLVSWANTKGITELAFWSMSRDNGTCPDRPTAASNCSGVAQSAFQFSSIFQGFAP
jgi:chitinase